MSRILGIIKCEADAILAEGIARSADDIDIVMINAFGFPPWTGGSLHMRASG